jgi:hypothetical protein
MAAQEETTLLDEDAQVSDVEVPRPGQHTKVNLCAHHQQVYRAATANRKCGVLTCFRQAKGAHHGVPLCFDHLAQQESGRSAVRTSSPHASGLLQGLRRRFRGRSPRAKEEGNADEKAPPARKERSPDPEPPKRESSLEEMMREAAANREERPRPPRQDLGRARSQEPAARPGSSMLPRGPMEVHFREAQASDEYLVKLRPLGPPGRKRAWSIFKATRQKEKVKNVSGELGTHLHLPTLGIDVAVADKHVEGLEAVGDPKDPSEAWLRSLLHEEPAGCAELGLAIKAYMLPKNFELNLEAWEGKAVGGGEKLTMVQLSQMLREPALALPAHAYGALLGTGPWQPGPSAEDLLGLDLMLKAERKEKEVEEAKPDLDEEMDVYETYQAALATGQDGTQAKQTVATVHELSEDEVGRGLRVAAKRRLKEAGADSEGDGHHPQLQWPWGATAERLEESGYHTQEQQPANAGDLNATWLGFLQEALREKRFFSRPRLPGIFQTEGCHKEPTARISSGGAPTLQGGRPRS